MIKSAADRQRSHVEQFQGTEFNKHANKLISQIDEAEIVLLSPELRREYDRKVHLFKKRRKKRQVDPTVPPSAISREGGSVGEGSGIAREYAGIVATLTIAFFGMAAASFWLPWGKLTGSETETNQALVADDATGNSTSETKVVPVEREAAPPESSPRPAPSVQPPPGKSQPWPEDAVLISGSYFRFYPEQLAWEQARARCKDLGGQLAVVNSPLVNDRLTQMVLDAGWKEGWLGGTDKQQEGHWVWEDGTVLNGGFSKWSKNQPNNKQGEEHYLLLWAVHEGEWVDQPNVTHPLHKPGFLCQWKPESKR